MTVHFHCGLALLALLLAACGSSEATPPGPGTSPAPLTPGEFTYQLEESVDGLPLWTTPATRKLRTADRAPEARRSGLQLSAARNEFEPLQLAIGPAAGTISASLEPFPNLGPDQTVELALVGYQDDWAETLTPLAATDSIALNGSQPVVLWMTVYTPADAPAGTHQTTLTVTKAGGAPVAIPVELYVFDFALPDEIRFATQINVSVGDLVPPDGSVDDAKTLLFQHRMTPKSVTWPSGFRWGITWDNASAPQRCEAFYDEPDEGEPYSIRHLARRYILGEGWNGVGFPNAMLFQFVDNSTPRPGTFCGLERGDHYGSAEYNAEWSQWLSALDDHIVTHGFAERAYYYVQNEPQNDADHALAAHLCRLTKAAAPHLRIAVSEEPKPEIAEDPGGACGYDIWIAHLRAYKEDYAWQRQRDHGELVWYYSLDHDPDPYFNPTDVARQGLHQRIIPWAAWAHRIRGWAYYDGNRFFHDHRPGIRAELLREGFEDYEYLYLANGGAHPDVDASEPADATARSVAASMTSWTKDADALMALRHQLGLYIEGTRADLPVLQADSGKHPRGAYYLNFQDPAGPPEDDPLVVDGKTWFKIDWAAYDAEAGYGWSGQLIDDPSVALYGYDDVDDYPVVARSYIYDDWGRDNLFEFDLAPGRYAVTVGVGRPGRPYPGQPHNVNVEGEQLIDDEPTTAEQPTLVRTTTVDLTDGRLSLVVAGRSEAIDDYSYTFLGFVEIEPAE